LAGFFPSEPYAWMVALLVILALPPPAVWHGRPGPVRAALAAAWVATVADDVYPHRAFTCRRDGRAAYVGATNLPPDEACSSAIGSLR
jgi:hypothetical protein